MGLHIEPTWRDIQISYPLLYHHVPKWLVHPNFTVSYWTQYNIQFWMDNIIIINYIIYYWEYMYSNHIPVTILQCSNYGSSWIMKLSSFDPPSVGQPFSASHSSGAHLVILTPCSAWKLKPSSPELAGFHRENPCKIHHDIKYIKWNDMKWYDLDWNVWFVGTKNGGFRDLPVPHVPEDVPNQIFVEIASVSRDKIRSGLMCILQFSSMSDPSWMVLDSWIAG